MTQAIGLVLAHESHDVNDDTISAVLEHVIDGVEHADLTLNTSHKMARIA